MKRKITLSPIADRKIQLDAPKLPQHAVEDGMWVIKVDELPPGQNIVVEATVPQKQWHPTPGDTLWGYLNDTRSDVPVYVNGQNVSGPFDMYFDPGRIPDATYQAWYTKTNDVGDTVRSTPQPVKIEGSTASNYPGPIFPKAVNGSLSHTSISDWNGTPIQAKYGSIQNGDKVTFHWKGYDESGFEIHEAAYDTNPPRTVKEKDATNGYIQDTIPFNSIQLLGDLGKGVATYEVTPKNSKPNDSLKTQVEISWSDIKALQLTATQGAANLSDQFPNLKPCNYGTVFGQPGLPVTISVSQGRIDTEAGNSGDPTTYATQLNGDGLASFRVSSSKPGVITVTASAETVGNPPSGWITFGDYADGSVAGIPHYNYTTHVPSDGVTPCSLYFQVDPALKKQGVKVTVGGHATIVGADPDTPHTRTITLYEDGSGFAEIVDGITEKVNVTLSVPGQKNSIPLPEPIEFIAFPRSS